MTMHALTEGTIRGLATPESFSRGKDYFRDGAVSDLVKRGNALVAEVEGNDVSPYLVTIELDGGGVRDTTCTCPYDRGGACKHVVAVLLRYMSNPEDIARRRPITELLANLDHARLIGLITKRAACDPGLTGWIEAELAAEIEADGETAPATGERRTLVDPAPIARQARAALAGRTRERRYWDDYRPSGDMEELHRLAHKAVPFLEAGDGRNALRVLEAVAEPFVADWLEYGHETDEHLYDLFGDLGRMMAEAILMSDLTQEERAALADTLTGWRDGLADYGVDDGFDVAVRALAMSWDEPALRTALAGKAGKWPPSGIAGLDDGHLTGALLRVLDAQGRREEYLNLARVAGQRIDYAGMLIKLGRVADAAAFARKKLKSPHEALDIAKALREAGAHEEALDVAESGLGLTGQAPRTMQSSSWLEAREGNVVALARWLRDAAGAMGKDALALKAARAAFEHSLSLADYQCAGTWAGEKWPGIRPLLLARLAEAGNARDRTEIYLIEDLIEEAVRSVGDAPQSSPHSDVLMRLAEAAHASHPEWVIRLGLRMAANIMDNNQAGHYPLAAQWLEKAMLAYDASGRIEEWAAVIETLIDKHRRKYKLKPLLQSLRIG